MWREAGCRGWSVKRVSVKGIVAGQDGKPYVRLDKLRSVRKRLMAEAVIDKAGGKRVPVVSHEDVAADRVELVLDRTPLYAEAGGQIADAGKAKEAAGKVTGNKETETEGKLQQAEGKVKEVAEDAKDAVKGAVNRLKGDK